MREDTPKSGMIARADELYRVLREHWDRRCLFRGEDSIMYQLRPGFGRYTDVRNTGQTERAILREFRRRAASMLPFIPATDWEWLAVAQHCGLATRLLDWTENALIAVYFATKKPETVRDRVLYILDQDKISDADESSSPFEIKTPVLYRPKHVQGRIVAQSGVFTVQPEPQEPFCSPGLERWVIPGNCVPDIHIELATYGIHEAFVFPDTDGLARYLND